VDPSLARSRLATDGVTLSAAAREASWQEAVRPPRPPAAQGAGDTSGTSRRGVAGLTPVTCGADSLRACFDSLRACLELVGMNGNEVHWGGGISTISQNFPKSLQSFSIHLNPSFLKQVLIGRGDGHDGSSPW
jgi:hypothetical protein